MKANYCLKRTFFVVLFFLFLFGNRSLHVQYAYSYHYREADTSKYYQLSVQNIFSDSLDIALTYRLAYYNDPNYPNHSVPNRFSILNKDGRVRLTKQYSNLFSPRSIDKTKEGTYLLGGSEYIPSQQAYNAAIVETDAKGKIIWQKKFDHFFGVTSISKQKANYLINGSEDGYSGGLTYSYPLFLAMDTSGNILKCIIPKSPASSTDPHGEIKMAVLSGGEVLLVENTDSRLIVRRLNSDYSIKWEYSYELISPLTSRPIYIPTGYQCKSVVLAKDSSIYVATNGYDGYSGLGILALYHLAKDGSSLGGKYYIDTISNEPIGDLLLSQTQNSELLLSGSIRYNAIFLSLDSLGSIIRSNMGPMNPEHSFPETVNGFNLNQNRLLSILTSNLTGGGGKRFIFNNIPASLDTFCGKSKYAIAQYNITPNNIIRSVINVDSTATFITSNDNITDGPTVELILEDKLCEIGKIPVDTTNVGIYNQPNNQLSSVLIYPNPFNDKLHINIEGEPSKKYTMELYNVLGQKILQQQSNTSVFDVETTGIVPGVYTYNITTADGILSRGKLVK
jgi:hypothetical protein